jgi:hypothetical protein
MGRQNFLIKKEGYTSFMSCKISEIKVIAIPTFKKELVLGRYVEHTLPYIFFLSIFGPS